MTLGYVRLKVEGKDKAKITTELSTADSVTGGRIKLEEMKN